MLPKETEKDRNECIEWAQCFIKDKIGIECNVINCWSSGPVTIVRLENEESKR